MKKWIIGMVAVVWAAAGFAVSFADWDVYDLKIRSTGIDPEGGRGGVPAMVRESETAVLLVNTAKSTDNALLILLAKEDYVPIPCSCDTGLFPDNTKYKEDSLGRPLSYRNLISLDVRSDEFGQMMLIGALSGSYRYMGEDHNPVSGKKAASVNGTGLDDGGPGGGEAEYMIVSGRFNDKLAQAMNSGDAKAELKKYVVSKTKLPSDGADDLDGFVDGIQ